VFLICTPPRTGTTWAARQFGVVHEGLVPSWDADYNPLPTWTPGSHADWAALPVAAEAQARGYVLVGWRRPFDDWVQSLMFSPQSRDWCDPGTAWRRYAVKHCGSGVGAYEDAVRLWSHWYGRLDELGAELFPTLSDLAERIGGDASQVINAR
jgi:hypothetical protein